METAIIAFGVISLLLTLNYHFFIKPMEKYKTTRDIKKHKLINIINDRMNEITLFSEYRNIVNSVSTLLTNDYTKDADYIDINHIRVVLAHFFLSSMGKQPTGDYENRRSEEIIGEILQDTKETMPDYSMHLLLLKAVVEKTSQKKTDNAWQDYLHAIAKYIYPKKKKGSKIPNIILDEHFQIMEVLATRQFEFYSMLYNEGDFIIDDEVPGGI